MQAVHDRAGAHANTALLVLRLPLFGTPEAPARAATMGGTASYAPRRTARSENSTSPSAISESLLVRLLDPSFYWQALRLDVPVRWLTGDDEAPSAVTLPPVRVSQPGV